MAKKELDLAEIEAYELVKKEEIEELNSTGYVLRHKKSGARVAVLINDDKNKVFNIGFRTPPQDETGVTHIIEHTVLCGSKKYPPKDPFVELVKGSLNTFLNAMTFPDKTIFPVASCNDKDFKNLVNVYMDAVFYPNIYKKEEIFKQEGWSYELNNKEDKLIYNGVVYNEMKGALSTPESILSREIGHEMFPDTCYQYESGGDPEYIPDLTYEDFLNYHRKYYHPSNSYIYLYGDMNMESYLNWMDEEYLSDFDKLDIDSQIEYQESFTETKYSEKRYSIGEDEDAEDKSMYTYSTTAGSALDENVYYAMKVLDYALISMPGAPLKKALVDAGIGKSVSGGFSSGYLQNGFIITAKEAGEGKRNQFQQVIETELKKLIKEGIDKNSLKAALNVIEFQYREADFGSYPKGLFYCMDMLESWLYSDDEPFMHIKAGDTFNRLKEKVESDYYENLIDKYLLNNPHKLILTMCPEKGLAEKKEQEIEKKLKTYQDSLSEKELEKIIADTKSLKEYQSEPSTEEELDTIPVLKIEDIDKFPQNYNIDERDVEGTKVIFSNAKSNGIAYVNIAFDACNLPQKYIPYLSLLIATMGNMNTKKHGYTELINLINMHSGGFYNDLVQYGKSDGGNTMLFENDIKVFYNEMKFAFDIIAEILNETDFSDTKRLYEIISEKRSKLRMKLISAGHGTAITRAGSYMTEAGYIKDMTTGIGYFHFLEELDKNFEEKKEEIVESLQNLSKYLFTKKRLIVSFTSEEEGFDAMEKYLPRFAEKMSQEECREEITPIVFQKLNEGIKIPSPVSYVARIGNFKRAGYEYTGALETLKMILDYDYLWNNVRVKGGAYGAMSSYGATSGNVVFVSYRDPNVAKTNEIFNGIPQFLRSFDADDRAVLKFIIGTISSKDTPRNPSAQGRRSFAAYISNVTYEDICKEREEILSLTVEKVRSLAPIIEEVLAQDYICVVGNPTKIEEDKELFMETKDLF